MDIQQPAIIARVYAGSHHPLRRHTASIHWGKAAHTLLFAVTEKRLHRLTHQRYSLFYRKLAGTYRTGFKALIEYLYGRV